MRVGIGYDLHRLSEGRRLVLGGVEVPFDKGLLGYSDADVLVHAVIDALLGAAALGNIDQHFPDTAPEFKDGDSLVLLRKTAQMLQDASYRVVNVDTNIVAERPRLSPHLDAMSENIADCIGVDAACVAVKAKTNEQVGAEGRGEAISAQAVALIEACAE